MFVRPVPLFVESDVLATPNFMEKDSHSVPEPPPPKPVDPFRIDNLLSFFIPKKDPRAEAENLNKEKKDSLPKQTTRRLLQWDQQSKPEDALSSTDNHEHRPSLVLEEGLTSVIEQELKAGRLDELYEMLRRRRFKAAVQKIRELNRMVFQQSASYDVVILDEEVVSLLEDFFHKSRITRENISTVLPEILFRFYVVCTSRLMSPFDEYDDLEFDLNAQDDKSDAGDTDTGEFEAPQGPPRRESARPNPKEWHNSPANMSMDQPLPPERSSRRNRSGSGSSMSSAGSGGESGGMNREQFHDIDINVPALSEQVLAEYAEENDGTYQLHHLVFDDDFIGLRQIFSNPPVKGLEVKDVRGNTPLLLAIQLGRVQIAEFLVRQGARVDVKSSDPHFHLLDETLLTKHRGLIRLVYRQLQIVTWQKWLQRVPKLMDALESMPDFYVEMNWSFDSNPLLSALVKAVAPSDTYKIWKGGSWLRVDSTIAGIGRGFKMIRGDLSLVFQGRGGEYPGDLLKYNHEKKKVSRVFRRLEKPTPLEVERAVSRLLNSASKQLSAVQMKSSEFEIKKCTGRRSAETIGQWQTQLYEGTGDLRIINHKKGENILQVVKQDEYFNEAVNLETLADARMVVEEDPNAFDFFGFGKPKKQRVPTTSKQRLHLKLNTQLWMVPNFPLKMQEILPVLEILAMKDKLVEKLNGVLTNKEIPNGHFPLKINLPLMLGIHALVEFQHFKTEPVPKETFKIPDNYFIRDHLTPAEGFVKKDPVEFT